MSHYDHKKIEANWQKEWVKNQTFKAENTSNKPKYYVLDMFPYPSGAGLHVGHPLGYIASDIVARYKRNNGFNVLHPMGYDAFGLPAEQYAIQTGQHPAITTEENIKRYREQLDRIGFSFDWSREIRTSDPNYYRWTQWIFIQLFNSWYNPQTDKAESISELISMFEKQGYQSEELKFTSTEWIEFDEKRKSDILLQFRLAFLSETMVNWCPALGSVLANDEIKDGVSERGGYPVERKLMYQWSLRISAYAERLLQGLNTLDWTESIKESQRNWIGKSEGCSIVFEVAEDSFKTLEVFTTRPDTIFGVSYMAIAPEHEMLNDLCVGEYREVALQYAEKAKNRSERERQAEVKNITGAFTGSYVKHPFTGKDIPIWIADYVLGGYGTGAVMAVPAHDGRDFSFAKHFELPILEVVSGGDVSVEVYESKQGIIINSDFLNGLEVKEAIKAAIQAVEEKKIGKGKTNYRLRDAVFGRQRYWGEPIPVYYENGIPKTFNENDLPLVLPEIDKYLPTETGEPPLSRAKEWLYNGYHIETTTMPGWAGSSWYFLRYMDAQNENQLVSKEAVDYWQNIDLYVGGSEHATGHLLYFRFWTKFLNDIGIIPFDEPAKKLVNQGMILGNSAYIYLIHILKNKPILISRNFTTLEENLIKGSEIKRISDIKFDDDKLENELEYKIQRIHVDLSLIDEAKNELNIEKFKASSVYSNLLDAEFILENGRYIVGREVEKMSKSKWNVVNPDDVCNEYGADTLRLYEMFLGPLQDAKPWSTQGIEGVLRFLRKFWRLFHQGENESFLLSDIEPTKAELKILHKTIKKATEDIDNFSFNTSVSAFMVCVNELQELKCNKKQILEPLLILLSPYAPHICEELWHQSAHNESIAYAKWPQFNPEFLVENEFNYPISFNGKVRFNLLFALDKDLKEIESEVLANEQTIKYLEGKPTKKVIVVKGKIVNVVV